MSSVREQGRARGDGARSSGRARRRRAHRGTVVIAEVGRASAATRCSTPPGCIVAPGFVDLHVHLREPGREEAETMETGSRAAALGGFTAVVAMPNTEPPHDSLAVVEMVPTARRRGRSVRRGAGGVHHGRQGGRAARADGRAGGGRRAAVHRRRQRGAGPAAHAAGDGVRQGSGRHAGAALRGQPTDGGGGDARGVVLQPPRAAGLAGDRRGADGLPGHRAGPLDRRPPPRPAPLHRPQRRPRAGGQAGRFAGDRRGMPASLHAHR